MKKVLLLFTDWDKEYWKTAKRAVYVNCSYRRLIGWEDLSKECPLPGLGIYSYSWSDNKFEYLKINNMGYTKKGVYFDFEPIKKSKTKICLNILRVI